MGFSLKLKKVSNPTIVKRKAKQIFGSSDKNFESKSKGKEYSIITPQRKIINFGSMAILITKTLQNIRTNNVGITI